jgi:pimeloyl-ACP methyl ester carboxylesterase
MRLAVAAAAAAAALLHLAPQDKEAYTYRIFVADREVGTERVEIDPAGARILVRSTVTLRHETREGPVDRVHRSELEADAKTLAPVRYRVRGRGPGGESEFLFEFDDASVRLSGSMEGKPAARQEAKRSAGAVLFDTVSIGHAVALLRAHKPEPGATRALRATTPATLAEIDLTIEDQGETNLIGAGRVEPVRVYLIQVPPVGLAAYVDRTGRLVLLRNPFTNTRIALDGFQEHRPGRRAPPERPPGVDESELKFANGTIELVGSLAQPRSGARRMPGVLVVGGPGHVDRDGNTADLRIDLYRVLAYALADAGFAVLRYDKRGVGRSGGDLATARLRDLVADAEAALRALGRLPAVDADALSIVGHSEGGTIGAILAGREPKLRALALLAVPAVPLDELLLRQYREEARARGAAPEDIDREAEARRRHFERIRASSEDWVDLGGGKIFVGWLREHLTHDPIASLRQVRAAVVVAQGMRDRIVFEENAGRIEEALKAAGNGRVESTRFEKLDHLFTETAEGAVARLVEERPVDRGLVEYLVDALKRHGRR